MMTTDGKEPEVAKEIDYKGSKGRIIMIGAKKNGRGFRGDLYVAVIQYGEGNAIQFDVVPDSTDPADVDDLPQVQTFSDRAQAIAHFMNLENHKDRWK
jgi:hypothetical protein